jgi:hypothetical protein
MSACMAMFLYERGRALSNPKGMGRRGLYKNFAHRAVRLVEGGRISGGQLFGPSRTKRKP